METAQIAERELQHFFCACILPFSHKASQSAALFAIMATIFNLRSFMTFGFIISLDRQTDVESIIKNNFMLSSVPNFCLHLQYE